MSAYAVAGHICNNPSPLNSLETVISIRLWTGSEETHRDCQSLPSECANCAGKQNNLTSEDISSFSILDKAGASRPYELLTA